MSLTSLLLVVAMIVAIYSYNVKGSFSIDSYLTYVTTHFPEFPSFEVVENTEDYGEDVGANILVAVKKFFTFILNVFAFPFAIMVWMVNVISCFINAPLITDKGDSSI